MSQKSRCKMRFSTISILPFSRPSILALSSTISLILIVFSFLVITSIALLKLVLYFESVKRTYNSKKIKINKEVQKSKLVKANWLYLDEMNKERKTGFEPATFSLGS